MTRVRSNDSTPWITSSNVIFCLPMLKLTSSSAAFISGSKPVRYKAAMPQTVKAMARSDAFNSGLTGNKWRSR